MSLTLKPKGERAEFYADDVAYFTKDANQGYEGEMTIADIPASFLKDCLGFTQDDNGRCLSTWTQFRRRSPLCSRCREICSRDALCLRLPCLKADRVREQPSRDDRTDDGHTLFVAVPESSTHGQGVLVKTPENETAYSGFYTSVYEFAAPAG